MHEKDYYNLFNSYNDSIEWLVGLLDQDIYKTKVKVVKGCYVYIILGLGFWSVRSVQF